jgi:DNA transformation protein
MFDVFGHLYVNSLHHCEEEALSAGDGFAEFLIEQLAPLGRITPRRMFGKTGLFCHGVMFGMIAEGTLFLRVADQNREPFREAAALPPLNYTKAGTKIDLAFWRVPDRLFDDPDELQVWVRAALAAATRVAAGRRRQPARRRAEVERTQHD